MSESITGPARRPGRGRAAGLVAFLFGLSVHDELPGRVLRQLLGELGMGPDASRALLARMRRQGLLAGTARGREVDYRLDGDFAVGFRRIRDQSMATSLPWAGSFHAVLHQVPETHRSWRDALRRGAVLSGYGVLQPGVLICPTDRSHVLAPVLADPPEGASVWLTTLSMRASDAAVAASVAWDLPDLARTYRSHLDHLQTAAADPVPGDGAAALRTHVEVLQPVLVDMLREPTLAPELVPTDWPGPELRRAIGRFSTTYAAVTRPHVARLLSG